MNLSGNYYKWFRTVINFCIYFFFIFALISNLCLYASVFSGALRYVVFIMLGLCVIAAGIFFRDRIKEVINRLLEFISRLSSGKLLSIIIITAVVLKAVAYIFFFFDSTLGGGDITIYASIAERIVENGFSSVSNEIYYLAGMGAHLAIFKYLGIPSHLGIFIVFLTGTLINYFSFKNVMGKEKAFLAIMCYLLMPSTSLLTFCCTHELFVYFYFSIILYLLSFLCRETDYKKIMVYGILL